MEELPRLGFEKDDTEKESGSDKKSKKTRKIGSFAKSSAETTPTHTDRKELPISLFGVLSSEKEATKDAEKPKNDNSEEVPTEKEATEVTRLKNEKLQADIEGRLAKHDEVIASTPPESPEHVQAVQAKAFEESLQAKAQDPELEADPVIEAEYARQLAEIVLDPAESGNKPPSEVEEASELSSGDTLNLQASREDAPDDEEGAAHSAAGSQPTNPVAAATSPWRPATPPPSSQPVAAAGGVGAGTPPPRRPNPPTPPPGGGPFLPPLANPNATPATPNVLQAAQETGNERSKKTGSFLVGGILGYMIGRRGGRKRAEKRLNPEIKELGNTLEATKMRLAARETELKQSVAEQLSKQANRPNTAEKVSPTPELTRSTKQVENLPPTPLSSVLEKTNIQEAKATPTAELPPLPLQKSPEKPTVEKAVPNRAEQPLQRKVEQLSTPQLLQTAEALFISGSSVRTLYETNQIDRRGLVAIVEEALKGGNIANAFEKVQLGRERQVERAREFRHDDPSFSAPSDDTTGFQQPATGPTLPNVPDTNSLQPLNLSAKEDSSAPAAINFEQSAFEAPLGAQRKVVETSIIAVAVVLIAGLILWAVL